MKVLSTIAWYLFGGIWMALLSFVEGAICCVTILFIPFGLDLFKVGMFFLRPTGKAVLPKETNTGTFVLNVAWSFLLGWENFLIFSLFGILFCMSIAGISFGLQYFKMARFVLAPLTHELTDHPEEKVLER
ncbi:MAG: hypothetical protein K6E59_06835 [Bacilli bacterium]|nr:hypothetical protein [Bacilli bacterium]